MERSQRPLPFIIIIAGFLLNYLVPDIIRAEPGSSIMGPITNIPNANPVKGASETGPKAGKAGYEDENVSGEGRDWYIISFPPIGNVDTWVMQTFMQLADYNFEEEGGGYMIHAGVDLTTENVMKNFFTYDLPLYMCVTNGQYKKEMWNGEDPEDAQNRIIIKKEGFNDRVIYGHVYVTGNTNWTSAQLGEEIGRAAEPDEYKLWGCCHLHLEVWDKDDLDFTDVINPLSCGNTIHSFDHESPKPFGEYEEEIAWPLEVYGTGWKVFLDDKYGGIGTDGFTNNFPWNLKLSEPAEEGGGEGSIISTWTAYSFKRTDYTNPSKLYDNGSLKMITHDSQPNIRDLNSNKKAYECTDVHDTYLFANDNNTPRMGYYIRVRDSLPNEFYGIRPGAPVEEPPGPQPPYVGNWPKINFPVPPYLGEYPVTSAAAVANVHDPNNSTLRDKEIVYCKRDSTEGGFGVHLLDSDASTLGMENPEGVFSFLGAPVIADLDNDGVMEIIAVGNGSAKGRVYIFNHGLGYETEDYYLLDAKTDATPSVGDINGDGKPEIVVGDDVFNVHVIAFDGEHFNLVWKRSLGAPVKKPVAIGDIDFDGELEIAAIGYNLGAKQTVIKVWDSDGTELNGGWTRTFNHPSADDIAKNNEIMLADLDKDGDLEVIFALGYHYMPPYPHPAIRIYDQNNVQFGGSPIITHSDGSILIGDYDGDGDQELAVANNTEYQSGEIRFYDPIIGVCDFFAPLKYYNIDNAAIIGDVDMPAFDPQNYPEVIYPGYILSRQPYLNTKNNLWGANFHPNDKPPQFPSLPQYGEEEWCCPLGVWDPDHNYGEGAWWHYGAVAPPKIADINRDGNNEIIIADMRANVHVYDTAGTKSQQDYDFEWGEFQHDALNTGNYEVFPPRNITVADSGIDQGHSLTVTCWATSVDDPNYPERSKRIDKYEIYRSPGDQFPREYSYVGAVNTNQYNNGYEFVDSDPNIVPLLPYAYKWYAITKPYGSPQIRRRSTGSAEAVGEAHDEIAPDPPENFAGEAIGGDPIYVHLTWDLSPDDPNYGGGEPGDRTTLTTKTLVGSETGRKPGRLLGAFGYQPAGGPDGTVTPASSRTSKSTHFPLTDKEGEAFKTKALTKMPGPRDYGPPVPKPPSNANPTDGGLDAGANDVEYYYIWKKEDGAGWPEPWATLPAGTTSVDDSDVALGHTYEYNIRAKDSENLSSSPDPVFIDLRTPPPPPPGGDGPPAYAPDSPFTLVPHPGPTDGGASAATPFADTSWGDSRAKPAKVITCKPNPVTGNATFTITAHSPGRLKLEIYDLAGRKVDTVLDNYVTANEVSVTWMPNAPQGLYLYALNIGSDRYVGKVIVDR